MFAGDLLPHRLADVIAERDPPVSLRLGQEDAPPILRHLHVVEVRPALLSDRNRGTQIHRVVLERDGSEFLPPLDELRLPRLERTLQTSVTGKIDVVGDLGVDVDDTHLLTHVLSHPRSGEAWS